MSPHPPALQLMFRRARGTGISVAESGQKASAALSAFKIFIGLLIVGLVILPGLMFPTYLRVTSTVLFLALALIVLRAYFSSFVSFRRWQDPPENPEHADWPIVSVVVPAYNEESVLPRAMEGNANIDYPQDRIEFLYVYEKRSTDRTEEIIREFASRDPRFVPVERDEPTGGKAAAANFGIARAKGDLVVSLDADHELDPGAVKRAARWFFSDPRLACVKGRAIGRNAEASFLAMQAKVERDAIEKGDIYGREVFRGFTAFGGGQAIFRKSVLDELGPMDESILVEDIEYSVRIHAAGYRLRVDPGIVSLEEHPPEFSAWWAQRMRWIRGWMQVAVRCFPQVWRMPKAGMRARFDMAHTFVYSLVPVAFAVLFPLQLLGLAGYDTRTYLGDFARYGWISFGLAPFISATSIWIQDARDGIRHSWREVPGLFTLWGYLVFQSLVFWSAFLDEFVLRRPSVYIKTAKKSAKKGTKKSPRPGAA